LERKKVHVRKSGFERTLAVLIIIIAAIPTYGVIYWYETQRYPLIGGEGNAKEFYITAIMWQFYPQNITVTKGDHVILHLTSMDVHHGFYNAQWNLTANVFSNQTTTIEFTADKVGVFEYYCTYYCGIGHFDMKGYIKVEDQH
jgi:heme/copper-type cytochrome/quinol oxidase subunit 2